MRYLIPYSGKFSRGLIFVDGRSCNINIIFADVHDRAITSMYKHAYFVGLIFASHELTVKTAKTGPLKTFPLYRMVSWQFCGNHQI